MIARNAMYTLGVILLALGAIGFYNNPIFGLFAVDTVTNLALILTGILALVFAAMGEASAQMFGRVFGIIYGIILILGLISPDGTILGIATVNTADNVLYFILAALFLYFGFAGAPVIRRAYASRDYDRDPDLP